MTTLKERVSSNQEVNQSTQRILVVDDENSISELIATSLKFVGFDVRTAASGSQALQIAEEFKPHALILDVMLPDQNGFEVCRQIRSEGQKVGVLFLTAKDSVEDKIAGLTIGGDDYVTKPYSKAELVARIRAVLRRQGDNTESDQGVITAGPVRIDVERHQVNINDDLISLPLKEFELLEFLVRNSGRVLTRAQLIDRVWGSDYFGDTKTLDVHVKRLRAKIETDPANPVYIQTIRGLGYKFEN
jgi:DNA-binding response OmpR family regulator